MSKLATTAAAPPGAGPSEALSDDRLVRRATRGDRRAFAAIYRRYQRDLYRYCLAIVANRADAEDALQSTMVKVLRALPGERRLVRLKPWLYRIAHNESVELLRRRRPSEPLDPGLAVAATASPAEAVELRDRLHRLVGDLGELPERQRGALVMRELGDLDFAEIGAALGTSAAVARQTVYEARLSLRRIEAGREMSCAAVTRALSDADGRALRRREIKAHLRACEACRAFRDEIDRRRGDLAALAPLPALAASGLLRSLLGGRSAPIGGGGLSGAAGGGAGKAVGVSALAKTAAVVAVVATVGVAAGDHEGVIRLGAPSPAPPHVRTGGTAVSRKPGGKSSPVAVQRSEPAARPATPFQRRAVRRARRPTLQAVEVAGAGARPDRAARGEAAPPTTDRAESPGGAHPRGRGHAKEPPAAAAHGEETAAAERGHGKGASQARGKGHSATREPRAGAAHPTPPAPEHTAGHESHGRAEPRPSTPHEPESTPAAQAEARGFGNGE